MKTKDDFSKGAKITSDSHIFGPPNGGSVNHHSPQSDKGSVRGEEKSKNR